MINADNLVRENKPKDSPQNLIDQWRKANEIVAGIFVIIIIAIFPLAFRNYYFDILDVKYTFYYGSVILMVVAMLLIAIIFLYIDGRSYQGETVRIIKGKFSIKSLRMSDWAMIVFLIVIAISTFQSEYFYESFWGNEGRYMGMFLFLLYGVSFFIIGHCLRFKQWYLDVFLVAGMIACIIGIMQYFMYDPIGFKAALSPGSYSSFISTFGNINTYTSYVALTSGMGAVLYTIEKNRYRKTWYLFSVVVSMFALITGISDNAYLALMALFGLLPLYLFNNLKGLKKYMVLLSILFTEFQVIDYIEQNYSNHVLKINGLFNVIVGYDKLSYLVVILWGICIILYVLDSCVSEVSVLKKENNIGRWLWLCIVAVVSIAIVYVLYDVNIAGRVGRYGLLGKYLFINDDWGTNRGYIWRIGMESYESFPILHKIFGYGPDTFGIITVNNYYEDMISKYGIKFDSAHNEYLQYLITTGIAGLTAYLSLLFISIREIFYASKKRPVMLSIVFAIVCYGAQAAVNISVPIVAPIMMTLLMIGVSGAADDM